MHVGVVLLFLTNLTLNGSLVPSFVVIDDPLEEDEGKWLTVALVVVVVVGGSLAALAWLMELVFSDSGGLPLLLLVMAPQVKSSLRLFAKSKCCKTTSVFRSFLN